MMPLLPAFEGELGTTKGNAIQAITHWNYASICRGGKSLRERLLAEGGQWHQHGFFDPHLHVIDVLPKDKLYKINCYFTSFADSQMHLSSTLYRGNIFSRRAVVK